MEIGGTLFGKSGTRNEQEPHGKNTWLESEEELLLTGSVVLNKSCKLPDSVSPSVEWQ